jgi:hypothetical protein
MVLSMPKRNYNDPTWRYVEVWKKTSYDLPEELSLSDTISTLQNARAKALEENPQLTDFQVSFELDEYETSMTISAMRPETADEKLIRTNKHPNQIKAKKEKAAALKAQEAAEVRRLCKKLKVQSPI